ncbi:putative disease resistance protein RGA4 [Bienertia sinuspersici]
MREDIWKAFSAFLSEIKRPLIRPLMVELSDEVVVEQIIKFDVKHWVCMCDMVYDHSSKLLDFLFRQQAYNDEILDDLLCNVSPGSKVILTAASNTTIGHVDPLSMPYGAPFNVAAKYQQPPQEAWTLFRTIAFKDIEKEKDKGLLDIGVDICINDGGDTSYYGGADIRHVSFSVNSSWKAPSWLATCNTLQSLLFFPSKPYDQAYVPNLNEILKGLTCLRALNFATLDLRHSRIISLPKDFHKLKNLRHLYTGGKLIDMPPNFGELKCLQTLDVFVVKTKKGLDELIGMNDLVGKLTIYFKVQSNLTITPNMLKDMNLTDLSLVWSEASASYDGGFSSLEPPPGLKSITICHWKGKEFLNKLISAKNTSIFNSLASTHIEDCKGYKDLKGQSPSAMLRKLEIILITKLDQNLSISKLSP